MSQRSPNEKDSDWLPPRLARLQVRRWNPPNCETTVGPVGLEPTTRGLKGPSRLSNSIDPVVFGLVRRGLAFGCGRLESGASGSRRLPDGCRSYRRRRVRRGGLAWSHGAILAQRVRGRRRRATVSRSPLRLWPRDGRMVRRSRRSGPPARVGRAARRNRQGVLDARQSDKRPARWTSWAGPGSLAGETSPRARRDVPTQPCAAPSTSRRSARSGP
jgi:hypothetical protein